MGGAVSPGPRPVPAHRPGFTVLSTSLLKGFSFFSPHGQVRLKGLLSRVSLACLSHRPVTLFPMELLPPDPGVLPCPRALHLPREETPVLGGQEAPIEHLLYPGRGGAAGPAPDPRALAL